MESDRLRTSAAFVHERKNTTLMKASVTSGDGAGFELGELAERGSEEEERVAFGDRDGHEVRCEDRELESEEGWDSRSWDPHTSFGGVPDTFRPRGPAVAPPRRAFSGERVNT
ncbi:hypothetical protein Scep_022483 [Stephania cephalantha]|uniref:Uncharacterized protein n=1 Tax=Stephania cephalantha TaxID=152367 RepID=A0AAP0FHQ5_9MAGN